MNSKKILVAFCCLISFQCIAQQQISVGLSVGRIFSISKLDQTSTYNPNFTTYNGNDLGYDFFLKYYPNPQTYISTHLGFYIKRHGVRIIARNDDGTVRRNISIEGRSSWLGMLRFGRCFHETLKNKRLKFWMMGGLELSYLKDRGLVDISFYGLETTDYLIKEDWYATLNLGLEMRYHFPKSAIGLQVLGGLGFVYNQFYFYEALGTEEWHTGVSSSKGDYVGVLLTYEHQLFSFKKDKTKKSKKKKRK